MHAHVHGPASTSKLLRVALLLTLGYIVVTIVAGLKAHSLALLSEAGHNVSDFLALLLSWVAVYLGSRPPSSTKTYGYHRAGVLAAFVNAVSLVIIAIYIFVEAAHRLVNPVAVHARIMMIVAAAGVVMNGVITVMLRGSSHDVNVRSAFIHMLGDTLSTASVIIGGWAILWTGRTWIDPALSFAIAALILWSSFGIIRETLNILLEGTPKGVSMERLAQAMKQVEGVRDVHDLHVWSIGSEMHALSCHIAIADIPPSASEVILRDIRECLATGFRIHHTTIQFEHEKCDIAHGCVMPVSMEEAHHQHHEH
ncbi:MAG TPA: cation diffusion facilitator family transporter [Terriglobales bacterium]|nr:cation diffusion facilitator family transporter [Terriglobales bacterium]